MTGSAWVVAALLLALAAGLAIHVARSRRERWRVWAEPETDPGADEAHPPRPSDVSRTTFADDVRAALDRSDGERPWRAPLRPLAERLPELTTDHPGLAAELLLRLGHVDAAIERARTLPADDPAGCWVRHWEYRRSRDAERALAALVAAVSLAGPADRPRYARALARWRRDHGAPRSAAEHLWDPDS